MSLKTLRGREKRRTLFSLAISKRIKEQIARRNCKIEIERKRKSRPAKDDPKRTQNWMKGGQKNVRNTRGMVVGMAMVVVGIAKEQNGETKRQPRVCSNWPPKSLGTSTKFRHLDFNWTQHLDSIKTTVYFFSNL
jgi:hypothetical protein